MSLIFPVIGSLLLVFTHSRFLLPLSQILLGLFGGVFWTLGSISYNIAVDDIGVTRSTPLKNMGVVLATVYGIFIFHEFSIHAYGLLTLVFCGSILMAFAAVAIANIAAPKHEKALGYDLSLSKKERKKYFVKGYVHASLVGVYFSVFTIPMRIMTNWGLSAGEITFWMSQGAFFSMLLFYLIAKKELSPPLPKLRDLYHTNLSGLLWVVAIALSIDAMSKIPMSVSWPITSLSALVTMVFGIWVYKEISVKKYKKQIFIGVFMYLLGIFLLSESLRLGQK